MLKRKDRKRVRRRVRYGIRRKIEGTAARPRLAVFRSARHIYAQAIDDQAGCTLAHVTTLHDELLAGTKEGSGREAAKQVGEQMAKRLQAGGVTSVVFDRGGFIYHGRIKALAEALREGGIKF